MIEIKDLQFLKQSCGDSYGRVFVHNQEYYRLIGKDKEKECVDFLRSHLYEELVKREFIPSTNVDTTLSIEGNPLVLHSEKCPEIRHYEWSFEMFKEAAVFMLNLCELCSKYGYELKDGHCNNITFHNGKPVFVDIGSFVKKESETWRASKEFVQRFYLPLLLWEKGDYCTLRLILESEDQWVTLGRLKPTTSFYETDYCKNLIPHYSYYRLRHVNYVFHVKTKMTVLFAKLLNTIIHFFRKPNNSDYRFFYIDKCVDYGFPTIDELKRIKKYSTIAEEADRRESDKDNSLSRFQKVFELMKEYCPNGKTVVDLAGNTGDFALFLNATGCYSHIFSLDYDGNSIDHAYLRIKQEKYSVIDTVWTNVMLPVNVHLFIPRIKSDIVIALSLTHHLILSWGFNILAIMERLKDYANRYVVVEFLPFGFSDGEESSVPNWYNQQWFKNAFEMFFNILHIEKIELNRIVFVGSIK